MKKLLLVVFCSVLLVSFAGCSLVQKPPDNSDEKLAWISKTEQGLDTSEVMEDGLYAVFVLFCADGSIDSTTCGTGDALHNAWIKSLAAARSAIMKFKNGEITQAQAQIEVEKASIKALPEVLAMLRRARDVAKARAIRLRSGDLTVPTGQKR